MFLARRRPWRDRRRSRGQSLVEFALVFPIFILLLAGMIDFGLGLFKYMALINATRDGARLAATACTATGCPPDGAIDARVIANAAPSGVALTNANIIVDCARAATPTTFNPGNCAQGTNGIKKGDTVRVTTNYNYSMIWPLMWGTQLTMGSRLEMMVE